MNHSTAPIVFQFDTCRSVRIQNDEAGNPLFQANDLCSLLAYKNPHDAVRRHVETDDLVKREVIDARGRTQLANFVREPGMWALILGSETEQAKAVKRWVTSEVLPAIRKTGRFAKVGAGETAPQTALTPDEYRELLEKRGKIIVDRKDYEHWQVSTEFGADPYRPYRDAAEWVVKLGAKHGRGAAVAMLAQFDANHLYRVPVHRVPELVAACKRALGEEQPVPAAPALTQQQAEEITQRLDSLARLFHPHSQPFADVMGISRALSGLDPKLGARVPTFVPLLTKAAPVPETPLRQQVVQTLRAEYSHGDYKALARDLGIHESSAKKIVGRLKLGAST